MITVLGPVYKERMLPSKRVTLASGLPWHFHISPYFLGRVYKAAKITLAGGLTLSLVNTPGRVNPPTRVNFLIVSKPFECNRTSK